MKFLVTSGGTKIHLDAVRSITNMSKGTFGSKIGYRVLDRGDNELIFLMARESKYPLDVSAQFRYYTTFDEYAEQLDKCLALKPDVIILAAAVSDYGVENYVNGKIRSKDELVIRLKPLPKLISTVREKCPDAVICGFKLLVNSTENELSDACRKSLENNKLDLVVGNDLRDIKNDNHRLLIVEKCIEHPHMQAKQWFSKKQCEFIQSSANVECSLEKIVVDKCLEHYHAKHGEKK